MHSSDDIERPWISGLKYTMVAVAVFTLFATLHLLKVIQLHSWLWERSPEAEAGGQPGNPLNPFALMAAPILLTTLCFGYAFLGHWFGRRTARWVLAGTVVPLLIAFIGWMALF